MSMVIMDPAEVRDFASALDAFRRELQDQLDRIRMERDALKSTWSDQVEQRFADLFDAAIAGLVNFLLVAVDYFTFLIKKAMQIEDYLDGG